MESKTITYKLVANQTFKKNSGPIVNEGEVILENLTEPELMTFIKKMAVRIEIGHGAEEEISMNLVDIVRVSQTITTVEETFRHKVTIG